ncbi:MAG: IS200/IS605 family transposase [Anaerolineales bacterium]|nr:IS200/IS605 family transposase [Anaerolineales bacterium]
MAYWRLHYHLVWATYQRLPLITESLERQIYGTILGKAKELGIIVHAIGNIEDHIHVAASIPPKLAVADCIKHFKGASSYYVNHQPNATGNFNWQEGYGALTFGDRAMNDVVEYVRNQKEHHRRASIRTPFERITEVEEGVQIQSD